ncbi:hypothetical protein [Parashewanella tropica]|uniref:hypothetical protein n=1 Tax=Parashewanella tropica TaxID=2547970 RepID=UPI00105A9012|nr:hypothetical protein [Parashewanella tropica]
MATSAQAIPLPLTSIETTHVSATTDEDIQSKLQLLQDEASSLSQLDTQDAITKHSKLVFEIDKTLQSLPETQRKAALISTLNGYRDHLTTFLKALPALQFSNEDMGLAQHVLPLLSRQMPSKLAVTSQKETKPACETVELNTLQQQFRTFTLVKSILDQHSELSDPDCYHTLVLRLIETRTQQAMYTSCLHTKQLHLRQALQLSSTDARLSREVISRQALRAHTILRWHAFVEKKDEKNIEELQTEIRKHQRAKQSHHTGDVYSLYWQYVVSTHCSIFNVSQNDKLSREVELVTQCEKQLKPAANCPLEDKAFYDYLVYKTQCFHHYSAGLKQMATALRLNCLSPNKPIDHKKLDQAMMAYLQTINLTLKSMAFPQWQQGEVTLDNLCQIDFGQIKTQLTEDMQFVILDSIYGIAWCYFIKSKPACFMEASPKRSEAFEWLTIAGKIKAIAQQFGHLQTSVLERDLIGANEARKLVETNFATFAN